MKIINKLISPIFNDLLITQLAMIKRRRFFKRFFWKRNIKKYATIISTAYKE